MPTSGQTTGTMNVRAVITAAMQDIGALGRAQTVNATDLALGIRHLNWMLKEWQADGVNLWREAEDTLTWTAGNESDDLAALDPPAFDVLSVRYDDGTTHRALSRWEFGQYEVLPNKSSQGMPTIYSTTKGLSGLTMRLWPVPTSNITLIVNYARVTEDVTNANETLDIPQEWLSCVVTNLAARLIMPFKIEDQNVMVLREAARLYALLRASDRPPSYYLITDEYAA